MPHIRRAGLAALVMLIAGCGSSTSSGSDTPTPQPRPTDAAALILEAIGKTAAFRDVTWATVTTLVAGATTSHYTGTITATKTPPRIDIKTVPADGSPRLHTVQDFTTHAFCTLPQGKPSQRFPNQTTSADTVDPFNILKTGGITWSFQSDADVGGHADWHVVGAMPPDTTIPNFTFTLNTREVFINPSTRHIDQVVQHTNGSDTSGAKSELTLAESTFRYDTGATVEAC